MRKPIAYLLALATLTGSALFADQAVISRYVGTVIAGAVSIAQTLTVSGLTTLSTLTTTGLATVNSLSVTTTTDTTGLLTANGGIAVASNTMALRRMTSTTGAPPTCSSTGLGTGSAAIEANSTDLVGVCVLSPTGSPGTTGVVTLTFGSSYGTNAPVCVMSQASGTANWLVTSIIAQTTYSLTAPTITWATGGAALTAGSTYKINYVCIGR